MAAKHSQQHAEWEKWLHEMTNPLPALRLHHLQRSIGESLTHQRKRFGATEVVIASVGGTAFPECGLGWRHDFGFVILEVFPLLCIGTRTVIWLLPWILKRN